MKLEINVPSDLSDITLGQYQRFLKVSQENPEGNFLDAKMIEIFCGIPLSDSYKLKMSSVNDIMVILNTVLETIPNHREKFTMNGVNYGFIPDLNEMSLGEYIDLDNHASNWENMHVAMNVLYRPIKTDKLGGRYNIVDYNTNYPEKMKEMPLDAVLGSLFFFFNLGTELANHTILSSELEMEKLTTREQEILLRNGVGTEQFTHSLKEILRDLKISQN